MTCRVEAEKLLHPAIERSVITVFEPLEILAHIGCAPRRIARSLCEIVPVIVVRINS